MYFLMRPYIKMVLKEICESVDWVKLFQDVPVVGCCKHCNESSDDKKGGEFLDQISDYRRFMTD